MARKFFPQGLGYAISKFCNKIMDVKKRLRRHLIFAFHLLIIYVVVSAPCSFSYMHGSKWPSNTYPDAYKNPRFWDKEIEYCFIQQETLNSCGPASVQMILRYLGVTTLPTQSELASEMNTSIYDYTYCTYMHIPFIKRGFEKYLSSSLSGEFECALSNLKGNISRNFPVIILTWYDMTHRTGHYRVVTGYNSSGIFVHDPIIGPNIFLNNTILRDLWDYSRFWALIILEQPHFDLIVKIRDLLGFPISGAKVVITDEKEMISSTNQSGIAVFNELPLGTYRLEYYFNFGSGKDMIVLTKTTTIEYVTVLSDSTMIPFLLLLMLVLFYILMRRSK